VPEEAGGEWEAAEGFASPGGFNAGGTAKGEAITGFESEAQAARQQADGLAQRLAGFRAAAGDADPKTVSEELRVASAVWSDRRSMCMATLRGIQEIRRATLEKLVEDYCVETDEAAGVGRPEDLMLRTLDGTLPSTAVR